ncbi:25d1714f-4500-42a9-b605-642e991ca068 [Thermothielavioides terrestris]|uniref:Aflatoxin regulatory protein domain-containing protein n=2 Tax=Thermothielavioides terrestris TaxID=2587410 RepID=G2QX44_THETT|nr:uncharacterized protein THITE_2040579 [Thermothielavioides terrestris NRRL 8126]AEO64811.1 hypothetical protein THITE_2040579 [Thermothielavioides terrestris NRRL 8126]SPQ20699.1 25d1714f-4500-42a9-b605-642e991ca068 [Thermothielavioides terrestris]
MGAVPAATEPSNVNDTPANTVQRYRVGTTPESSCSATAHNNPFDGDSIMDMLTTTDDALAAGFEPTFGDQIAAWSAALTGTGSKPWDGYITTDHSHHALANASDDSMTIELTPPARHLPSPPPQPPPQPQPQPTASPTCLRASDSRGYGQQLQVARGSLAALVRRAAELCENMYELRVKYHDGHSDLDPPGHFPVHMSGEVLQAADGFLRLLRCFFLEEEPASSSTPILASNPSSRTYTTASAAPEPARRVTCAADRPAALTLIASYRRLLDLYLLYYQAVFEYVRDTEPSWRRDQPIWKDLNVGGAPLRAFGDLHIKLVVQAAARLLEDVEGALGLSEGCRVSRKSAAEGDDSGNGVLGAVVTSRFVEQCIAEGSTGGSEQGPGIIARIRETAASLAAMLDTPVAIERFNRSHI